MFNLGFKGMNEICKIYGRVLVCWKFLCIFFFVYFICLVNLIILKFFFRRNDNLILIFLEDILLFNRWIKSIMVDDGCYVWKCFI